MPKEKKRKWCGDCWEYHFDGEHLPSRAKPRKQSRVVPIKFRGNSDLLGHVSTDHFVGCTCGECVMRRLRAVRP